jgi:hypothetical protein
LTIQIFLANYLSMNFQIEQAYAAQNLKQQQLSATPQA